MPPQMSRIQWDLQPCRCSHTNVSFFQGKSINILTMKRASPQKKVLRPHGKQPSARPNKGRIHPVIIYPFHHPANLKDLEVLYDLVAQLDANPSTYARPLTILDCKTRNAMQASKAHLKFRVGRMEQHSDVLETWGVDTCQTWYTGLGEAFQRGRKNDAYWLIPGDFNYGSSIGHNVLGHLHDLPEICMELNQDICIGEIHTDHNNSKQLIDTYGTFALLYNWFPQAAHEIRAVTERPRSEFFALQHGFLGQLLNWRWYAYEQTVVMLLHAVWGNKAISRFFVGEISDLPTGQDSLNSAMQQVERTERVLKTIWRDRHHLEKDWSKRYRELEAKSDQVRNTAHMLLENLLT